MRKIAELTKEYFTSKTFKVFISVLLAIRAVELIVCKGFLIEASLSNQVHAAANTASDVWFWITVIFILFDGFKHEKG